MRFVASFSRHKAMISQIIEVVNIMSISKDVAENTGLAGVNKLGQRTPVRIDWKRIFFILLGIGLFLGIYYSPPWAAAIDPLGVSFELSREAKGALAVFGLAAVWWVFEVVPIGVTSLVNRYSPGSLPHP